MEIPFHLPSQKEVKIWLKLASKLSIISSNLKNEFWILRRLLYKNNNQHRNSLHFQKLKHINKLMKQMEDLHMFSLFWAIYNSVVRFEKEFNSLRKKEEKDEDSQEEEEEITIESLDSLSSLDKEIDLKIQYDLDFLLFRIWKLHSILQKKEEVLEKAGEKIFNLITQTFFLPFSITTFAVLSRIFVVENLLSWILETLFNELFYPHWVSSQRSIIATLSETKFFDNLTLEAKENEIETYFGKKLNKQNITKEETAKNSILLFSILPESLKSISKIIINSESKKPKTPKTQKNPKVEKPTPKKPQKKSIFQEEASNPLLMKYIQHSQILEKKIENLESNLSPQTLSPQIPQKTSKSKKKKLKNKSQSSQKLQPTPQSPENIQLETILEQPLQSKKKKRSKEEIHELDEMDNIFSIVQEKKKKKKK